MIDTKTGTVVLDDVQSITPFLTLDVFLASPLAQGAQSIGVAADWPRFYVGKHQIFGDMSTVILMFYKQQLVGIGLDVLHLSIPDPTPDLDDVAAALALKVRCEAWLAAKLGPAPYLYPWGRIDAVYSPQDITTGIFVAYPTPVHSTAAATPSTSTARESS
jgi:hypothetical protein